MVAVTATTGMAGSRINGTSVSPRIVQPKSSILYSGQTTHSWAGLTGSEKTVADALKRIKSNPQSVMRWNETKALVCDEGTLPPLHRSISECYVFSSVVSILDAHQFDVMEAVAREIRGQNIPFGGLQVRMIKPAKLRSNVL